MSSHRNRYEDNNKKPQKVKEIKHRKTKEEFSSSEDDDVKHKYQRNKPEYRVNRRNDKRIVDTKEKQNRKSNSPIKKNKKSDSKTKDYHETKKRKQSRDINMHEKSIPHKITKIVNNEDYTNISDSSSGEILRKTNAFNEQELRKKLLDKRIVSTNYLETNKNKSFSEDNDKSKELNLSTEMILPDFSDKQYENLESYPVDNEADINNSNYKQDDNVDYMRSKFESNSHYGSDEENNDRSRSRSSNSSSCSSESFGSSISSSRNPRKKPKSRELEFSPLLQEEESEEEYDPRPFYYPAIQGCRAVEQFTCLNRIEEGSYGVVFRAKDLKTNEIVALKRLKMEKEKDGFPITSLREINTLMKAKHENIVTVREVVVGSNMDKIYLVMDFVEHDLKSLMTSMVKPFEICEVKCLMIQLLHAVAHLHDNWILHRDLKTSNLLLSHKGILKVADFGLAREYGSPLKNYTKVVVTLWYRAPELLLGTRVYSTPIDMWSVGCIFGELILMSALFPGKSEVDQINLLFSVLGTPNELIWPGYRDLPNVKRYEFAKYEHNRLSRKFGNSLSESGMEFLNRFLAYCPERRISAETALKHSYFNETPKALSPEMFPTRPAKSEGGLLTRAKHASSPKPPSGGQISKNLEDDKFLFK